jgi:hypothetical protein
MPVASRWRSDTRIRICPLAQVDAVTFVKVRTAPNLQRRGAARESVSRKTLLVEVGEVRKISDIDGMHILHLNDTPESRKELAQRLKKLKFGVVTTGTSWLRAGKFDR